MLKLEIDFGEKVDQLSDAVWAACVKKMTELTNMAYNKVLENLSGKILQTKSGQLKSSIQQEVTATEDTIVGMVYVSLETPKAWALEVGGKGYYPILPVKAQVLRFYSKSGDLVFAPAVNHPPSRDFGYLREASEEMEPLVGEGLQDIIQQVLDGRI